MKEVGTAWRWAIVVLIVVLGSLACGNVEVRDDALELLPDGAVRGDISLLQRMGLVDRIFITLSLKEDVVVEPYLLRKDLQNSVEQLGKVLRDSGRFSLVISRLPAGYESSLFRSLRPSLPLLLDGDDFRTLEKMTDKAGIAKVLAKNYALLNSPAGIALKKQVQDDPLGLVPLVLGKLRHLQSEFSMAFDNGFLMSRDGRSCLVVAESILPLTDSRVAEQVDNVLKSSFQHALAKGIRARIIGTLPHTLANSRMVKRDLRLLLPAATVLLILLLAVTLRNIKALAVLSVPFMAAPPAIALTGFIFDKVSGLALGFGIVLLGIAVDFSIHLYLTLSRETGTRRELLKVVGRPVACATATTTAVFIVLFFSQVASHRQMATLALIGILLAVLFSWLLIPTIIKAQNNVVNKKSGFGEGLPTIMKRWRGKILLLWLFLILCGVFSWPLLQYNGDLRVLDVPTLRIGEDERHFTKTWGGKGDQAFVVARADSLAGVLDKNYDLYRFLVTQGCKRFQSFAPILPGPLAQKRHRLRWRNFWQEKRSVFHRQFQECAMSMGFSKRAFVPFFSWLDLEPQPLSPSAFLKGPLQPMLASMLKESSSRAGRKEFLALTTVAVDGGLLPELLTMADRQPGLTVLANSKWRAEVEQLLRRDILTLSLVAGCVIVLLVTMQFRRFATVIAVLAPVVSALSAMAVFCFLSDGELNMMHLIMGIMVIGLSVDYGIFIVCARLSPRQKTAGAAVSICAASSLVGFGVLAFAHHPALHSLGITVLVGIGAAWPVAIFVSPCLLEYFGEKFPCNA